MNSADVQFPHRHRTSYIISTLFQALQLLRWIHFNPLKHKEILGWSLLWPRYVVCAAPFSHQGSPKDNERKERRSQEKRGVMESWLPFKQPENAESENEPIARRQVRNRDSEISHVTRKPRQTRLTETQRQSIRRRMKERASLAGASGWLRLFNALINPLLKAMQRVSGFVLWPRDYSGINKGWAGNIDEIPPPPLCFALWLFSNKAADRDDMQQEMC